MKTPQSTLIYVHVRRELVEANRPLEQILDDVNAKVRQHSGIILANRQFLRQPVSSNWRIETHFDDYTSTPFDQPKLPWGVAQREYFGNLWGLCAPYQYAQERDQYDQFCISALDPTPYLVPGESILAMIEAVGERQAINCPCHYSQIVYTSRQRLLCMGCGYLYRVLTTPVDRPFDAAISNDRWQEAFDKDGELIDDELEIPILHYRDIERAPYLWTTDAWDEATWLIDLYAYGSKEEIDRYEAGLPTAEDFIAAGWVQVPTPPSASAQLSDDAIRVGISENSATALKSAAEAFARSRTNPDELREAVLNAFQASELILKMRLETIDSTAMKENNPTILRRLIDAGVTVSDSELETIGDLRRLRNQLQHADASYGYRQTRRLLRKTFTFLDRFTLDELDIWIGHVCGTQGWQALMQIAPIEANADRISQEIVLHAARDPAISVVQCESCKRERMIMFDTLKGHCLYCQAEFEHAVKDNEQNEHESDDPNTV